MRKSIALCLLFALVTMVAAGIFSASQTLAYPLQARTTYATSSQPWGVAAADLNSDGYSDVVLAAYSDSQIDVFMANGDGTYAAKVSYATATNPTTVTITDVNNDGNKDVITGQEGASVVTVFLGNGDGTFDPKSEYAVGGTGYMSSATTCKLNNDNYPDIVVAHYGSTEFSKLLNNGDGTFGTSTEYTTASGNSWVLCNDLNADGYGDVITYNGAQGIAIRTNNGVGGFNASASYNETSGTFTPFLGAVAGDFNGDGKLDVVGLNGSMASSPRMVTFFAGNGDGTFATGVSNFTQPTTTTPFYGAIAAADFDSDGDLDVAVSTSNTVSTPTSLRILANDGAGNFTLSSAPTPLRFIYSMAAGYADADIAPDLFTGDVLDNTMSVHVNNTVNMTATVTATVDPSITFVIRNSADTTDSNTCAFGTFGIGSVSTCAYRLAAETNAANGFSISVTSDGDLRTAASDTITAIAEDGTVSAGTEGYGVAITGATGLTEDGDFSDDDTPVPTSVTALVTKSGPHDYIESDLTTSTLVTHRAAISALTEAGTYNQILTYTAVANF